MDSSPKNEKSTASNELQFGLTSTAENLAHVAQRIVESLQSSQPLRHEAPVPDSRALIDLVQRLKAIVYPGFRSNETSPKRVLADLNIQLAQAHQILSTQIAAAIARHWEACQSMGHIDEDGHQRAREGIDQQSDDLATRYIQSLPEIREALVTDVQAAYDGDPACRNRDEVILCYPGLQAVTVYRLAHQLHLLGIPFLPRMMTEWIHSETGVDIHPGARIGRHFFIDHGTGVVIGETCEIGEHVKIYQGVTLGALSFAQDNHGQLIRDTKRHPTIEDRVVIYANATVLGGKTIVGHDSIVGSSVWLTNSVEPFTTVIMEKPKLRIRNQLGHEFDPPVDFQI